MKATVAGLVSGGLLSAMTAQAAVPSRIARRSAESAAASEKAVAAKAAKPAAPLPPSELQRLGAELFNEDESKVELAIKTLSDSGAPNGADPLLDALAAGTTPWLAGKMLDALGKLKDPKSIQILVLYSGNRNLKTRSAAVRALGALPDPRVVSTLIERLGDPEPEVRAIAADALADRKESRAVDRLFKLTARNDAGAAAPLGRLAGPDVVPQVAELRGRVDDAVLAAAFGEFIKRADMPDRLRIDIVRTLGGIPGAAATTALVEYLATVPDGENRPSKDEAQKVIDRRGTN